MQAEAEIKNPRSGIDRDRGSELGSNLNNKIGNIMTDKPDSGKRELFGGGGA